MISIEEKQEVKRVLMELIEECRKGLSSVNETASDRLRAVAEAANALTRL